MRRLGTVQPRKAAYDSDLIDEDDNGLIEPADFRLRADRLVEAFKVTDETERARLPEHLREWWDHLSTLADADNDGKITREEWRGYWMRFNVAVSRGDRRQSIENLERTARKTFRTIDHTDTGRISREEFSTWLKAWDVDQGGSGFRQLDREEKGFLIEEDLAEATTAFYLSTDPAAPGNMLYGELPDDISQL